MSRRNVVRPSIATATAGPTEGRVTPKPPTSPRTIRKNAAAAIAQHTWAIQ